MNQQSQAKLQAVRVKLDRLRGDIGMCLTDAQNILNAETDDEMRIALQEVVDLLDEMDDKFSSLDTSIETIVE